MNYLIKFDGACRGNPGLCGAGFVIFNNNEIIYKDSIFISNKNTNNYAEYNALLLAIEKAIDLGIKDIKIEGDSLLAINQINGKFKVKSENIKNIYDKIIENLIYFDSFIFNHIRRENNKIADKLANKAIDDYLLI